MLFRFYFGTSRRDWAAGLIFCLAHFFFSFFLREPQVHKRSCNRIVKRTGFRIDDRYMIESEFTTNDDDDGIECYYGEVCDRITIKINHT